MEHDLLPSLRRMESVQPHVIEDVAAIVVVAAADDDGQERGIA